MPNGTSRWKSKGAVVALIILVSAVGAAGAASITLIPPSPCTNVHGTFQPITVVADQNGYNGSRNQGGAGPFMTIQTCDTVIFTFVNRDVQAHGFAVEFYAANGLEAVGGDSGRVQFLAFKPGEFRVYCNTQCSIHRFMQNAKLTVGCCSVGCC